MIIWNQQRPIQQQQQPSPVMPPPSLSPPPRQSKSKRDSYNTATTTATTTSRRPLIDPTLTPRVKPISIKTRKQPSLLRLSLDAELLQSPDGDNDSFITFKTGHSTSSASITPTTTPSVPFRSGTLGATNNHRANSNAMQPLPSLPPPLPPLNIPLDPTVSQSRPQSQATTTTDSPISMTASDEDEQKLTLIERRRRRSPLSMPNTDQLTLALDEMLIEEQQQQQQQQHQPDDSSWRQQLLEQTLAYSFNDQSRQEAMMALEGKKVRAVSLQPIAHIRELDDHFEQQPDSAVVRDKAQYEAIVARTTTHRRQLSYEDKKQPRTSLRARPPSVATVEVEVKQQPQQHLEIITENEIATCRTPTSASSKFPVAHSNTLLLNVTPETPPYHKQTAPSLISAPSTPNSIDSSVIEQDDYMNHQVQLCLTTVLNDVAN